MAVPVTVGPETVVWTSDVETTVVACVVVTCTVLVAMTVERVVAVTVPVAVTVFAPGADDDDEEEVVVVVVVVVVVGGTAAPPAAVLIEAADMSAFLTVFTAQPTRRMIVSRQQHGFVPELHNW